MAVRLPARVPPLRELRRRYLEEGRPLCRPMRAQLESDPRKGAAQILRLLDAKMQAERDEKERQQELLRFERSWWAQGCGRVAGVDEVGMSPWAGPVVAAAVILVEGPPVSDLAIPPGIRDSKQIPELQRERLAEQLKGWVAAWAIGSASPEEIARFNVYHAGRLAMRRAVAALRPRPDALLVDARHVPGFEGPQEGHIRGDGASLSIAAASILAKVTRDRHMRGLDGRYPGYGFSAHKGYGTAAHQAALQELGGTPAHRWTFEAVRKAAQSAEGQPGPSEVACSLPLSL